MDADPNLPGLTIGALTTLGAGFFGWLKGRNGVQEAAQKTAQAEQEAQVARENATTEQVKALTEIVQNQGTFLATQSAQIQALIEARSRQSEKISATAAEMDRLRAKFNAQIQTLTDHVRALEDQVRALGGKPVPPPSKGERDENES